MSRRFAAAGLLLWVTTVGAFGAALPLCEYRSLLTDLSDLTLSFTYQYHNDPYGIGEKDVSTGQFGVDYVRIFDSPEYGYNVTMKNGMTISAADLSSYSIVADGDYRRYFASEEDLFAYAGGSARSSSSFEALGLSFDLGIGYGRFTDVTPMATAVRIDDYLVRQGSLSDHLHPVDLQVLAREIGSASSYESIADLLAVIQETIESSSLAGVDGLDALDISEMTHLIQEEGFSRYCGWNVQAGLGYELLDPSGGSNDLLIAASFNYAFTTTPKAQVLVKGSVSGPPELFETNRIDLTASYDYLMSDFLSLSASYNFSRETWASEPTDIHQISVDLLLTPLDNADVVLGMVLEHRPYYLEWNVDVRLSLEMALL
jgi:hypothetical protein